MGIKGFILVIGLLSVDGNSVETYDELSTYWYETKYACESAKDHPIVQLSYRDAFPGYTVRMFCQPVIPKGRLSNLQIRKKAEDVD